MNAYTSQQSHPEDPSRPTMVAEFHAPVVAIQKEQEADQFKQAFRRMLGYETSAETSRFLYKQPKFLQGRSIPQAGYAWDMFSTTPSATFSAGKYELLELAFDKGLSSLLQPGLIRLTEYGPGTPSKFLENLLALEKAITTKGRKNRLGNGALIDYTLSYAVKNAQLYCNHTGQSAKSYQFNFLNGAPKESLEIGGNGLRLSTVWGGTGQNGYTSKNRTAIQSFESFLTTVGIHNGEGSVVIYDVDLTRSPEELKEKYTASLNGSERQVYFYNFISSVFKRAVYDGIITDPEYNVEENWHFPTDLITNTAPDQYGNSIPFYTVRIGAVPLRNHTMPTIFGDQQVTKDDEPRSQMNSHKPTIPHLLAAMARSGIDNPQVVPSKDGSRGVGFGMFIPV